MTNEMKGVQQEPSNAIFTIPNVISFIRLCMVPFFFALLINGRSSAATAVFAIAASTDFVDGQIARRTNSVSKLGQLLDPAVDRFLMIFAVLGLLIVGRLPLWIVLFVLARDLYLLIGGSYLLKRYKKRVPVIYAGKFATTFLFVGFAFLILDIPVHQGLGLVSAEWLPGLNGQMYCDGIWLIYLGLALSVFTTVNYTVTAYKLKLEALAERCERNQ